MRLTYHYQYGILSLSHIPILCDLVVGEFTNMTKQRVRLLGHGTVYEIDLAKYSLDCALKAYVHRDGLTLDVRGLG